MRSEKSFSVKLLDIYRDVPKKVTDLIKASVKN